MSEEIDQLRALRGIPKGLVTKMTNWALQLGETASLFELEVKLEQLKKYEASFEKAQSELELKDATERAPEASERGDFEDRVALLKARLMELRSHFQEGNPHETSMGSINVDISGSEFPKFDLPKFDGDYKAYPHFMDAFKALVHNSRARGLTDVKKLAILKTSLSGKALEAVRDLPMGATSYAEALNILKERFENKRLIFESYIKGIWEQPKATNTATLRQVCDSVSAVLRGLRLLGTDEEIASGVITHLILSKCDTETIKKWEEMSAAKMELVEKDEFLSFLKKRCTQLESVEYALRANQQKTSTPTKPGTKAQSSTSHVNTSTTFTAFCPVCDENHSLTKCEQFKAKPPRDRYTMAKNRERCIRCLERVRGHRCTVRCDRCQGAHNTLLHFDDTESSSPNTTPKTAPTSVPPEPESTLTLSTDVVPGCQENGLSESMIVDTTKYTFLATALVLVRSVDGNHILLRLLLDGGSQSHLITERAAKLLGLPQHRLECPLEVRGINSSVSLTHAITANVRSLHHDMNESVTLIVHRKLLQRHPAQPFEVDSWNIPQDLPLADRKFYIPQDVDIILNANQSYKYLLPGQHSLGPDRPILQNTRLGWIVVGDLKQNNYIPSSCTNTLTDSFSDPLSLAAVMQRFWEVESLTGTKIMSTMEQEYETHFKSSYSRNPDGRFVVRLPFARSPSLLGASRTIAMRRLYAIKRKIDADPEYGRQYKDFMDEYIALGHCSLVKQPSVHTSHCYIPHFAVQNPDSTTTKTRVVFDASCKTDSGVSLNDVLMVGPTIQKDLVAHLLNFRAHPVAITGDLSKMYRNIDVANEDKMFQLILWFNGSKIDTYCLNTVTYGTASAPFVAIRCLQELAECDGSDLPLGAKTLKSEFYVDDWLGGANTPDEAIEIHNQLQKLLTRGQLTLRKIQSNSPKVMQSIPDDLKGKFVTIGDKDVIKTLGMNWLPEADAFVYHYEPCNHTKLTKRAVLSETGRLFDPLGLLQPVIVKAKIFMQQLWTNELTWDDPLTPADEEMWKKFREELKELEEITIPRFVCQPDTRVVELHGFCDASERAYCACIYVRTVNVTNEASVRLLVSKTRVAPLKTVTLPRLELLGALLVAELFNVVCQQFPTHVNRSFLWSDSTITLKWITSSPHKWVPYVGTRVTKIQTLTDGANWRHVPSPVNPADIGSRGIWPSELVTCTQWFNGPAFLWEEEVQWPETPKLPEEVPETKKQVWSLFTTHAKDIVEDCKYMWIAPMFKFLAWPKVRRVFGYVDRFISRLKAKWRTSNEISTIATNVQPLSTEELNRGLSMIAKVAQRKYFSKEINALSEGQTVQTQSKLSTLGPILDPNGVIRVGGRVKNAPRLEYDEKFPIVLPYEHPVTEVMIWWAHVQNLHAPQTALLSFVRQQFWPIRGKNLANKVVRKCFRCSRLKPVPLAQIMADLPPERVSEVKRPFLVTAVDFAGPFTVHHKGRGSRTTKVYLAVYVCFSSKAVYLDLVENLSTDAFQDSLRRFVGRRGIPAKLYSDNGTNFVGARNKMNEFWKIVASNHDKIGDWCRDTYGMDWQFMPPRTPHFGGLHESAVKSFKQHFTKVVASSTLTIWEMMTVVVMIEGVLNSRPLVPLALCPQDNQPLTPGHILIGEPLNALPDPICDDGGEEAIYMWSKTVVPRQLFWRRWSKEYLQSLQHRYKWAKSQKNINLDDLVLLIDKNTPAVTWTVGRVTQTFPGKDGNVRVVNIKTKNGVFKRGITEICIMPKQTSSD